MADDKWIKLEKLHEVAMKSAQITPPKHILLSWKCPKCSSKLSKDTLKQIVFLGDTGTPEGGEVVKKILADTKVEPNVYNVSLTHYTCKCGYEFAREDIDPVGE